MDKAKVTQMPKRKKKLDWEESFGFPKPTGEGLLGLQEVSPSDKEKMEKLDERIKEYEKKYKKEPADLAAWKAKRRRQVK